MRPGKAGGRGQHTEGNAGGPETLPTIMSGSVPPSRIMHPDRPGSPIRVPARQARNAARSFGLLAALLAVVAPASAELVQLEVRPTVLPGGAPRDGAPTCGSFRRTGPRARITDQCPVPAPRESDSAVGGADRTQALVQTGPVRPHRIPQISGQTCQRTEPAALSPGIADQIGERRLGGRRRAQPPQ